MKNKKRLNSLVLYLQNKGNEKQRRELFSEIWECFYPGLILFIYSFAGIKHEADDHAQEIFTKVFCRLDSYNPFYSFSTWFYRIARNYCIDVVRKKQTEEKRHMQIQTITAGEQISPEDLLMQKEQLRILKDFITSVTDREKRILLLRYSENLKYREISDILGINESTIRSIVRKLKIECKKYMEKAYER
jgi:RNA polymerase sigma factor (sigma-70 family)